MNIIEKANFYRKNFLIFDNWEDKYQYLIDLSRSLPAFPPEDMIDNNRVKGCMSQVWLISNIINNRMQLRAQSDAIIVRGLIALIIDLCQSQLIEHITAFNFDSFFYDIGLNNQLSPNRRNGLVYFYLRIQELAKAKNIQL